ncbi:MAG: hypothetical protein SF097_21180 [Acidobacteriota bacterium]|nr:hypothetical protein [Acidobacteriota bacterium]
MQAYKTFVTIQHPNQIVLDNLPFKEGQQVEILVLAKDELSQPQVQQLKSLFTETQSLPQIKSLSEEEILDEIRAYRSGQ